MGNPNLNDFVWAEQARALLFGGQLRYTLCERQLSRNMMVDMQLGNYILLLSLLEIANSPTI